MQSDIVQRLEDEYGLNGGQGAYAWKARELCGKAAAEITRLTEALRAAEEQVKGLREALERIEREPIPFSANPVAIIIAMKEVARAELERIADE